MGGDFSLLCYVCKANEDQPKHDCRSTGRYHGSRFSVWLGLCGELPTEPEVVGLRGTAHAKAAKDGKGVGEGLRG